ncbi:MAG: ATP-binding protein [Ancrocorticia sp.]|uniref:ATP-binding protein n=1 Tax=Ancrocorticia sp. TaxID=2593684 RepID=UPI003F93917D
MEDSAAHEGQGAGPGDGARAGAHVRYPLRRPRSGRVIFGVCQGIADHLDVPVKTVRIVMALSIFMFGAGIFLYMWLFVAVSASNERPPSVKLAPAPRKELGRRQKLLAYAGLAVVAAVVVWTAGVLDIPWGTVLAVACIVAGGGLAWSNLSAELTTNQAMVRLGVGIGLLVIGVLVLTARDQPLGSVLASVLLGVAILTVAGLALWPVIQRLLRELRDAEEKSARESERAQMAAHLHDSVLQTLTLIRNQAGDPEAVRRLARVQERQLRSWLYSESGDGGSGAGSGSGGEGGAAGGGKGGRGAGDGERRVAVSEAIKGAAAQIEDLYGVGIEAVVVGEGPAGAAVDMLVAATKEALANAVRHGAPPVSLYAELARDGASVYVRDHGSGFDLDGIPEDRHGVRDSIIGRVERAGGSVAFRRRDPGTEVEMTVPWGRRG